MRTVSAALPAAVGATSAAQKMSGSRRITSSVKGKRARPADSVSFKVSKVRRSFATASSSLTVHSLLTRCEVPTGASQKENEAQSTKDGGAVSLDVTQQKNTRLQFFLGQKVAARSTLKRSKTLRCEVVTQKQHQTTLVLQPVDSKLSISCQNEKLRCTASSATTGPDVQRLCVLPSSSSSIPSREQRAQSCVCATTKSTSVLPKPNVVSSKEGVQCNGSGHNKKVECSGYNTAAAAAAPLVCAHVEAGAKTSSTTSVFTERQQATDLAAVAPLCYQETGADVTNEDSNITSSKCLPSVTDVVMQEGVQRRHSLRSHLFGGRKRYDGAIRLLRGPVAATKDQATATTTNTATTKADVAATACTTTRDVQQLSNNKTGHEQKSVCCCRSQSAAVCKHHQQHCSTTPATVASASFVTTVSTCDSFNTSIFESHYGKAPVHVYAKDRTPVIVSSTAPSAVTTTATAAVATSPVDPIVPIAAPSVCYNGWVAVPSDRLVLEQRNFASSLRADMAAYGQCWFTYHKQNEHRFQPWQMTMVGKIEKLRLGVIAMYWNSATLHPISPATIYVAINNFGRLLHHWSKAELEHPSAARWALAAVIAFRLAFKAEERPEVMCEVANIWSIFPMFQDWDIDRSTETLNKSELEALRLLGDSMDVPLGPMFLALYINAAGWPEDVAKDYHELSLYLLALTTFSSTKDHFLRHVMPSRLAAAALVLAVKIINGDRACARGMLHHLPGCAYPSALLAQNQQESKEAEAASFYCCCRYEFYPERLKLYTGFAFEELTPVVKGLSALLRSKPTETCILSNFFPLWANNDWQ